jgi:hypothetical protein
MGAANVEPAPLMVPEPDADVPPLDDELLHAAPASRTATATTPAAALLEAALLEAALLEAGPGRTILMTAPPGLTAPPGPACAAGVLDE